MFYKIKSILFVLLFVVLVACSAPATPVPTSVPTPVPTPVPVVATTIPAIQSHEITIPMEEGDEPIQATITGNGEIAVMMHKTRFDTDTMSRWTPLIDILSANEKLRMVLYTLRNDAETPDKDSKAVFDYLRAEGINGIICISAGLPSVCADLQNEPEMIGMVVFPPQYTVAIEAGFPKLFITADTERFSGNLQQTYENSAEPKTFKSYAAAAEGPVIFINAEVGPQVLADITDFINGIVSGQ